MKIVAFVLLLTVPLLLATCSRKPLPEPYRTDGHKSYEEFRAGIKGNSYDAPEARKQKILSNYSRLQAGMTKQEIASIIGAPDYSHANYGPKGPGEKWLGWSWDYILAWPEIEIVNEAQAEWVEIFFDTEDRATWIAPSSKTKLPALGGPNWTPPHN